MELVLFEVFLKVSCAQFLMKVDTDDRCPALSQQGKHAATPVHEINKWNAGSGQGLEDQL